MRIVYQAENIVDAHLVKNALEGAGIRAFVAGEYLTGGAGLLPAMDLVAVMVDDADIETAGPIVADIDAALRENRANPNAFDALPDPA
ncbi:DUF2007 domain-containing protein [Tahibacter soli]|jgi:hypothetical protein|uniref:DUF2007 domain-containing protein n=1 Tax=Tahibacter soli TaxID=2983605 RepID=A0A9X3YI61_9GAMM|nr:DUF2007 domain-containing protein [Tahibacter soli]MDC8011273.1 DUF2007 domain-containing protein [Tahibacter soli]